jgi:hypothetical protein
MPPTVAMTDLPDVGDHALPCRPTVSCTADITAPGTLELEGGLLVSGASESTRTWSYPFLLKQTLTRWLQLQVASNGFTTIRGLAPAQYLDNIGLGAKLHLADQGAAWPSLAVTALVSVPTFDRDGYLRIYDGFLTGHASKDVAWLHVDWNVGVNVWRLEGAPVAQGFTALALSTSLPPPFSIALEGYGFTDAAPIAPRDGGLRAALGTTARSWLVFDLGGDVGFFPSTRAYSVFVGMTVIPVVWWRPPAAPGR